MFQDGAETVELGDDLQAVSRANPQDPDNVRVVQAPQGHHVLQRRVMSWSTMHESKCIVLILAFFKDVICWNQILAFIVDMKTLFLHMNQAENKGVV